MKVLVKERKGKVCFKQKVKNEERYRVDSMKFLENGIVLV